ncbi:hypothetical protein LSG23_20685 (plasmid) [Bacillus velezensis]|uniref:hypothetical protein n=1 Tax=Bacillus velezensis TaxID=492670 RepID=UPI000987F98C|nr:hypothetical protein [Bacillus velezensis]AQS42466.1 hypothetical protein BVH55_00280 [Bacillus velezensis]WNR83173.1 hypothetical protein RP314_20645 [Bacillus velezensis]
MKKYAIRLHQNKCHAHLIFHATPTFPENDPYNLYEHQWYLADNKNTLGNPIEDEQFESYSITTNLIEEEGYDGLYLYCKYTDINTKQEFKSEYIRLYSNFNKIVDSGAVFDKISIYDETGYIKKLPC